MADPIKALELKLRSSMMETRKRMEAHKRQDDDSGSEDDDDDNDSSSSGDEEPEQEMGQQQTYPNVKVHASANANANANANAMMMMSQQQHQQRVQHHYQQQAPPPPPQAQFQHQMPQFSYHHHQQQQQQQQQQQATNLLFQRGTVKFSPMSASSSSYVEDGNQLVGGSNPHKLTSLLDAISGTQISALQPLNPSLVEPVAVEEDVNSISVNAMNKRKRTGAQDYDHDQALLKKIAKKEPSKELRFTCSYPGCNRRFAWKWTMETHAKTHLGDAGRTHVCKECGKGFFTKGCLKSHMAIHMRKPGQYPCKHEGCTKTYSTAEGLSLHIRNHHKKEKKYVCPQEGCPKRFVRQADLRLHIIRVHCKDKPFPCSVPDCKKSFACLSELKRHLKFHKDSPFAIEALERFEEQKKQAAT